MGLKELEREQQRSQQIHQEPAFVTDTAQQVYAPQDSQLAQQQSNQAQDELMAWAVEQQGKVAIPTETAVVGQKVEKRLFKSPTVTPVYGKVDFHVTRAKALRENLPKLYEEKGTRGLVSMAAQEIDLTLNGRLAQTKVPELILLEKLNQGQKDPSTINLEELRRELSRFGVTSGEECIPLEGAFTPQETLVLMIANLCRHLQTRTDGKRINGKDITSAKQAIDTLSHTSNSYANVLIGKVYARNRPILQRKEREKQATLDAQRLEAEQSATAREEKNRRENTAILGQFVDRKAIGIAGLSDPARLQALKDELRTLMVGDLTRELLDDQGAQDAFQQLLEEQLSHCAIYQRTSGAEVAIGTLLEHHQVPKDMRHILRSDKGFLACFLDGNQALTTEYLNKMTTAITQSKSMALAHLASQLPDFSPDQHQSMVEKLSRDMPTLFLGEHTIQITRQVDMLVHYHRLMMPQLREGLSLTKGTPLATMPPPPISALTEELLSSFQTGDAIFQFLPEKETQSHLEEALLRHLARKTLGTKLIPTRTVDATLIEHQIKLRSAPITQYIATAQAALHDRYPPGSEELLQEQQKLQQIEADAVQRLRREVYFEHNQQRCLELGKTALEEMSLLQRRELVEEMSGKLQVSSTLAGHAMATESSQLRQRLLGDLLDGESMEYIGTHATVLREELKHTEGARAHFTTIKALSPISADGSKMVSDFTTSKYNTALGKSHSLRTVRRFARMDQDLERLDIKQPQFFRGFVVEELGSTTLNELSREDYEKKLTNLAKRITTNMTAATAVLDEMTQSHIGMVRERDTIRKNLYSLMVKESPEIFSATMKGIRSSFSSGAARESLRTHTHRQDSRIAHLQKQFPTLAPQDLRNIFAQEGDILAICTHSESQWSEYAGQRMAQVLPVLQLIDREFSYIKDLPDQLRLVFGEKIYQGAYTVDEATKVFRSHYESLIAQKVDKTLFTSQSIEDSVNDLLARTTQSEQDKTVLSSYFTFLLAECTLSEVLELDSVWKERGAVITSRVLENDALVKSFVAESTKGIVPTEAQRLETGFILYLRQSICTQDSTTLQDALHRQWATFSQLDGATKEDVLTAHVTMAQRVTAMRDVERHRKESVALLAQEETQRTELFQVQTGQRSIFASPLTGGRENWAEEDVQKGGKSLSTLQKAVQKATPDAPQPSPMATGILAEYLSCRKDFAQQLTSTTTLHHANHKLTQLEHTLRKHCEESGLGNVEETVGKTIILTLSLYAQGALDGLNLLNDGAMDDAAPLQMLHEHLRRENLMAKTTPTLQDATHGELLGLESLTATTTAFDQAISHTKTQEEITQTTTAMAQECIQKMGWEESKASAVLSAWLIYRHKDAVEQGEKRLDVLRTMAQSDFANDMLVDLLLNISNRDVHQSYFDKGTLGGIGSTTLNQEERTQGAMAGLSREGFETWLLEHATKDQAQSYSALSLEERQLFAYGLSMPSHLLGIGATEAGRLVKSAAPQVENELATRALQRFILTGDTAGLSQLDYQRSVAGLCATRNRSKLGKKAFNSALAFSAFCIQARREALPPDTQRLCDAKASIQAAGKDVPTQSCHTTRELHAFLLQESAQLPPSLHKRLEGYDENKFLLLVNLLQNRTLLDRTCTSKEKDRDFVDQEGRDTITGEYASNLPQALMAQRSDVSTVEQAFLMLHSYQVQDGLELGESLHKSDLNQESLQRKTAVDMTLLREGMSMVEQIFHEGMRLQAVSNAPQLIQHSDNMAAKTLYNDMKDRVNTEDDFTALINRQVQQQLHANMGQSADKSLDGADSELLGLYSAYMDLSEKERHLFFKAMSSRDVLDISKQGIWGNRFGFKDRTYVNPLARDSLLDEYATTGDVVEGEACIQKAFASLLSTQVDDDQNLEQLQQEGGTLATSHRETAVDWKLFKRALQLVRRANNERDTYNGQFELYVSTGNVHKEGEFHFESDFLRRNIHNAGSRVTRFLGRRAAAQTVGRVSDALGDHLSENLCNLLGSTVSNAVEDLLSPEQREEQVELTKARQLELGHDFTSIVMESKESDTLKLLGLSNDTLADIGEFAGHTLTATVSTVVGNLLDFTEPAMDIYHGVKGLSTLKEGLKTAAAAQGEDEAVQEQAKERQTDLQQARFAKAKDKLNSDLSQASHSAKERQVDAITEGVGEMICSALSVEALDTFPVLKVAGEVINEALKIVNFARAAFDEKKMVDRNLEANQLWAEKKGSLAKDFTQIGHREAKTYDFALAASGFENMTEYASAKGLDFVQSLLFSASKFNALHSSKILARTILMVLKVEQVSEDYHTLNANVVFDRLMGGKQR